MEDFKVEIIPPKVRAWVYQLLAIAFPLEAIFNWLSPSVESKVIAVLGVFGFVMARVHTPKVS